MPHGVDGLEKALRDIGSRQEALVQELISTLAQAGVKFEWYCDWLNPWDIESDDQIKELLAMAANNKENENED